MRFTDKLHLSLIVADAAGMQNTYYASYHELLLALIADFRSQIESASTEDDLKALQDILMPIRDTVEELKLTITDHAVSYGQRIRDTMAPVVANLREIETTAGDKIVVEWVSDTGDATFLGVVRSSECPDNPIGCVSTTWSRDLFKPLPLGKAEAMGFMQYEGPLPLQLDQLYILNGAPGDLAIVQARREYLDGRSGCLVFDGILRRTNRRGDNPGRWVTACRMPGYSRMTQDQLVEHGFITIHEP